MKLLYNCSIHAFSLAIGLVALFHRKARQLYRGRRGLLERIEASESWAERGAGTIWVHCASLGEFEQGRPLIEELRRRHPKGTSQYQRIVVTFFSPSGYEIRQHYDQADAVYYLPSDTPRHARRFVAAVRPELAIFVKYEYWHNYLSALRAAGVRSCVVSAIFRPDAVFFRQSAMGRFMRQTLELLDHLFVQNEASRELLEHIGWGGDRVTVSGDTRFDRVVALAEKAPVLPSVERFVQAAEHPVMVCGSTWPPDEEILLPLMAAHPEMKFIVAPHEIDSARIDALIRQSGRQALRYTTLTEETSDDELQQATLLVIDTIGVLSGVYRYGQLAYIGGGFGRGIHNTLEAATWGVPVLFGPHYQSFAEAVELIEVGAAASVKQADELLEVVEQWSSTPGELVFRGAAAESYVRSRVGATKIILDRLGE